jgi:hypothetical protein
MGYMVAMALLFKGSILSLWFAAKLKIIAFIKGFTLFQGILLLLKRWLMDSVVLVWLKEHILDHMIEALHEIKNYYLRLNIKEKIKNGVIGVVGAGLFLLGVDTLGYLDKLLFFTEVKMIATALFQLLLGFLTKVVSTLIAWLSASWFAPLLEVLALSYLLTLLEKWFGVNNPLSRTLNRIADGLNQLLYYLGIFKIKHIDPMVECRVVDNSKKINKSLKSMITNKKIQQEYRYFEKFERIIMKGHIDAYHSFKGIEKITNKKELYTLINQKTNDNIDIVAYISRNHLGLLLDEAVEDSFYHDIFLLESFASHQEHGVKIYDEPEDLNHINHTDFWVLNTSAFALLIGSHTNNFEAVCIPPHSLQLIKTSAPFCYASGDVYGEYEGVRVCVSAIPRIDQTTAEVSKKTSP